MYIFALWMKKIQQSRQFNLISNSLYYMTSFIMDPASTVCLKKNYTLLKWLPNEKYLILGRMIYMYG